MARTKKPPVNPMLGTSPEARRRQAEHARRMKKERARERAAHAQTLADQPRLRALAEERLAREAAGEEPPFVLH